MAERQDDCRGSWWWLWWLCAIALGSSLAFVLFAPFIRTNHTHMLFIFLTKGAMISAHFTGYRKQSPQDDFCPATPRSPNDRKWCLSFNVMEKFLRRTPLVVLKNISILFESCSPERTNRGSPQWGSVKQGWKITTSSESGWFDRAKLIQSVLC